MWLLFNGYSILSLFLWNHFHLNKLESMFNLIIENKRFPLCYYWKSYFGGSCTIQMISCTGILFSDAYKAFDSMLVQIPIYLSSLIPRVHNLDHLGNVGAVYLFLTNPSLIMTGGVLVIESRDCMCLFVYWSAGHSPALFSQS